MQVGLSMLAVYLCWQQGSSQAIAGIVQGSYRMASWHVYDEAM